MKPKWNSFRQEILEDRYALRDEKGNLLEHKIEDIWDRISKFVGTNIEEKEAFRGILEDFKFVPGGRMLAGLGSGSLSTFFNCYVIPISTSTDKGSDSRESLIETLANIVEITSRGGGVGLNFSVLRPRGSYVSGVKGYSSGPVSWMQAYDGVISQVMQGGSRRGAQMYMLDIWHPSIEEFVSVKNDLSKLRTANLSVGITDDFMTAVKEDKIWPLVFPDITFEEYNSKWDGDICKWWFERDYPIKLYKNIKARKLWRLIAESAHRCGEPGIVFLDRYQRESNTKYFEKILGVNPCGEQGLGEWGVCNLGSINLVPFVNEDLEMNWSELEITIKSAVRFLDNVIDLDRYLNDEIKEKQPSIRRVGLGTMGLADVLIILGLKYGSKESLSFISELYRFIRDVAYKASIDLAIEKSPAKAFVEEYLNGPFIKRLPEEIKERIRLHGIRNLSILTQAPTGTTSILAGVSSGIEPVFSFEYTRTDRTGTHEIKHWLVSKVQDKDQFVSSHQITPEDHIMVQSCIQKYIDSSISKTINAPHDHGVKDVEKIYLLGYDSSCKGVTYFRDGSRPGVLSVSKGKTSSTKERSICLVGRTSKIKTPLGNLYLTLNEKDGKPYEVFCQIGKAGSDVSAFTEAIGRLISITLQNGTPISEVINQLSGIGGSSSIGLGKNKVRSVPDAIASLLSEKPKTYLGELCPKCGTGIMINEEGCSRCQNCGFSKCD